MPVKKVVNLKDEPYDVYIGRGSKWGNPFSHIPSSHDVVYVASREESLRRYEEYLHNRPELLADLHELNDKVLGCFCKPKPCHGDVLAKLVREYEDDL